MARLNENTTNLNFTLKLKLELELSLALFFFFMKGVTSKDIVSETPSIQLRLHIYDFEQDCPLYLINIKCSYSLKDRYFS